jgi:hypothetical protein
LVKEKYQKCKRKFEQDLQTNPERKCSTCKVSKPLTSFIKVKGYCIDCNNERRREKYKTDEEHRKLIIQQRKEYKQKKVQERRRLKLEEIGEGNKKCSKCFHIKPKDRFRYNRLKCKDCERDDPPDKFKRVIRSRIFGALKSKSHHTIEYLGCNYNTYFQWILDNNHTFETHGSVWHIDHVIPLAHFNLDDEAEQMLAFNWRNTAPLPKKENLQKNRNILKTQVEQHWKRLVAYHEKNNIDMPDTFITLFAKHLDAGNPLEPSLPLTCGNACEDLG